MPKQNNENPFDAEVIKRGDFRNLSYYPKWTLKLLPIAHTVLLIKKNERMRYGSVSKGNQLYKSDTGR
jgi:hypothetical protein